LDKLFAAYREVCPDTEPGPDFMPQLWARIEARRSFTLALRRFTGAFVTAAAAICIAVAVYTAEPADSPVYTTTYVETLGTGYAPETLAYVDLVSLENSEGWEVQ